MGGAAIRAHSRSGGEGAASGAADAGADANRGSLDAGGLCRGEFDGVRTGGVRAKKLALFGADAGGFRELASALRGGQFVGRGASGSRGAGKAGKREEDPMSASKVVRAPDFSSVTELPRQGATRMQMSMLRTRYGWAAQYAAGKYVLEVACGAGLGLVWLAQRARRVAAGDIDQENCRIAREACCGQANIRVEWMDALELPFEARSFDLVVLFEALYYLTDVPRFLAEARRVLRPGGALLISTVNCEWSGFHPSFLY